VVKKVLSVLIAFSLVFSLSAVEAAGEEPAISWVEFTSLENFLNAYLTAKEGGDISEFVDFGFLLSREKNIIEGINFTELETIYLLTGIPENFFLHKIHVNEYYTRIIYVCDSIEITEQRNSYWGYPYFNLSFSRKKNESPLERSTGDILIDGIIYNRLGTFKWEVDGKQLSLDIPREESDEVNRTSSIGLINEEIRKRIVFTETKTVDLTDTAAVRALLDELTATSLTSDALLVLRAAVGLVELTAEQAERFGISGVPAASDALRILRVAVGL
jgi:hypothetical protein